MSLSKISAKKKEKPKKSRSEVAILNAKYMGPEPAFAAGYRPSVSERAAAYRWYSYMADADDAREYATAWLASVGEGELAEKLATVPNTSMPLTAAWIARLMTRGVDVSDSKEFALKSMREAADKYARAPTPEEGDTPAVKGPTRAEEKAQTFIADVETFLDSKDFTMNPYDALVGNNFPVSMASTVRDYYAPLKEEIELALSGKDRELTASYSLVPKKTLREEAEYLGKIIDDCDAYATNSRRSKAPRKKKVQSAEKKLKHFEWAKENRELRITSCDPASILGARELWLFNSKYKLLTVLIAAGEAGLDVKGKSVVGHDEGKSRTRSVGRRAQRAVEMVRDNAKATVHKVWDVVEGRDLADVKNRVSSDVVLLRAIR